MAAAQRTFLRSCDCDYMIDGKCAYTLLLPVGGSSETCPQTSDPTYTNQIQNSIEQLDQNVTKLALWLSEQARILNNVQGTVINLQESISSTNIDSDSILSASADSSSIISTINDHSVSITNIQEQVQQLNAASQSVDTDIMTLYSTTAILREEYTNLQQSVGESSQIIEQQALTIQELTDTLTDLQVRYASALCNTRGLLVSGPIVNIPDSSIKPSTQFDPTHGANRSRIFVSEAPGAWCPGKSNMFHKIYDHTKQCNQIQPTEISLFGYVIYSPAGALF